MRYKPVPLKSKSAHHITVRAKHILRILLDSGKGSNEIFLKGQQTGLTSYKKDVLDTIKTMQEAELIDEVPDPTHRQKRIKKLTPLGKELALLMRNIDGYNESYLKLKGVMNENFTFNWANIKDDIVLANILRTRRWTEDEIAEFIILDKYRPDTVRKFESTSSWTIIYILLAKYSILMVNYRPNQTAKIIVNQIITDIMTEQLFSILENVTIVRRETMLENITNNIVEDMRHCVRAGLFKYHSVNKQIEDVMLATFSILSPTREIMTKKLNILKTYVNRMETDDNRDYLNNQRKFIALLEKTLNEMC